MATTGLKSRIIYKEHSDGVWAGAYKMLMRATSIPSPIGDVNEVDISTLEDDMEVHIPGRRASASMDPQGAFEKDYVDELTAMEGKDLDFIILYGTDGLGSEGKLAFSGRISVRPDDATDDFLTMTVHITVQTVPAWISDNITVTTTDAKTFTVAAV